MLLGWLPQRRVTRRRAVLPLMRWYIGNTPRSFTSASMEWALRTMPLRHSKECLEICHQGEGNSRCVQRHQAQQSFLGQRNKECPTEYLYLVVQNTWGWRFTKQALYVRYLCTCHSFRKSIDSKYGWKLTADCQSHKTAINKTKQQQKLLPEESILLYTFSLVYIGNPLINQYC